MLTATAAGLRAPRRYGIGKWRLIQKDPELGAVLSARSNVDLKARRAGLPLARRLGADRQTVGPACCSFWTCTHRR
jgi:L-alanine-DL-glutamate epimerase-like enolase superfamily enzyme